MTTPDYPTTETIARIMATGYNRHVSDHGPGGSYASETMESRDGHGVVVDRGGSQFAVRVERLPAMTTTVPKTPGQHWAGLRVKLTVRAPPPPSPPPPGAASPPCPRPCRRLPASTGPASASSSPSTPPPSSDWATTT